MEKQNPRICDLGLDHLRLEGIRVEIAPIAEIPIVMIIEGAIIGMAGIIETAEITEMEEITEMGAMAVMGVMAVITGMAGEIIGVIPEEAIIGVIIVVITGVMAEEIIVMIIEGAIIGITVITGIPEKGREIGAITVITVITGTGIELILGTGKETETVVTPLIAGIIEIIRTAGIIEMPEITETVVTPVIAGIIETIRTAGIIEMPGT